MPENKRYESWGRYPRVKHQKIVTIPGSTDTLPFREYQQQVLAFGQGRSYGDTCLNDGGILIDTADLSRILDFDPDQGILRCESGVTLSTILNLIISHGWFLPVVPGTKHVTVGGAIAHDVHGKNHHRVGTFGCHVLRFELLRSTGERIICSHSENSELYRATIAGMGLTGLILWAEIRLKRLTGSRIAFERTSFNNLKEFFSLAESADRDWEYTVAWLDSSQRGDKLGRGVFTRGNFVEGEVTSHEARAGHQRRWPVTPPGFLLNSLSIRSMNRFYYRLQSLQTKKGFMDYEPFFFPLDAIADWNRIYGPNGFFQYQCVVPPGERDAIGEILARTLRARLPATLAVLKSFGDKALPGMMSFPRRGFTLALDFPNRGTETLNLLDSLDEVTMKAKGAVYPAKDARMSAESFQTYFPQWEDFARFIDPKFSSSFWRRVTEVEVFATRERRC
jgi:FAD/FMN-containing dehydrogenase